MIKKLSALIMSVVITTGFMTGCTRSDIVKGPEFDGPYANYIMPVQDEEIAVVNIKDYGTVKIKFFPEYAPMGVKNFKALVNKGYYDGLTFHRILKDFCIQGGDPQGIGIGGSSIWGEDFAIEPSDKLFHFKGAVAYAHAPNGGNGSQFYFTMGSKNQPITEEMFDSLASQGLNYPKEVRDEYIKSDGPFWLDGQYTIFAQVFEGMEILDKINLVSADETGMPDNPVIIESIKIEKYSVE